MTTTRSKTNPQKYIDSLIASLQQAHQEQMRSPRDRVAATKRDRLLVSLCDALGYRPQSVRQVNGRIAYDSHNAMIDFLDEQVPNWRGFEIGRGGAA